MLALIPCRLGRHSRETVGRAEEKSSYVLIDKHIAARGVAGRRRHVRAQPRPVSPKSGSARLSVRNLAWPSHSSISSSCRIRGHSLSTLAPLPWFAPTRNPPPPHARSASP